ncbi:MAG: MCE family protein [Planctomycetaceae bacterium]|nr:MCE family protein [Planctomycetaceae bacterium]
MDDRTMQWRTGIIVLFAMLVTIALTMLFAEKDSFFSLQRIWRPNYRVAIKFPEAPGVTDASPVRKSGILIGRVVRVELLDDGGALVTTEIDRDRKLFNDEVCRINRTLFGDSVLEFVKMRDWKGAKEEIDVSLPQDGIVAPDPIQVVGNLEQNLSNAISSVGTTSDRIGAFMNKLDYLVGSDDEIKDRKEKMSRIIDKTADTAEAITRLADTANELIGDPKIREELKATLEQMPELMQETRLAIGRMNQSMDLVDRNLSNVEEFTEILGKQGGETLIRLNESVDKLDRLMSEVLVFSQSLNNSKGTIGQLVHNPELYHSVNRAVKNVEELTQQLRPIVNDARIFSDKIARHPEILGVRGAIKPEDGTKSLPPVGILRR